MHKLDCFDTFTKRVVEKDFFIHYKIARFNDEKQTL